MNNPADLGRSNYSTSFDRQDYSHDGDGGEWGVLGFAQTLRYLPLLLLLHLLQQMQLLLMLQMQQQ